MQTDQLGGTYVQEGEHAQSDQKLIVNSPGDVYEREADSVAQQVMRLPEPRLQRRVMPEKQDEPLARQITPLPQRLTELELEDEEEKSLQARPSASREAVDGVATAPVIVHDVLRSPGQRLDEATRSFMEARFGHDFSRVRVHADRRAAESARAVDARAYTVERNIVFGAGQHAPGTDSGRALLAHELTHVLQQQALGPASGHVQRYRSPDAVNFGAKDTPDLKEKQFDPKAPDPFVEHIQIDFTATKEVDGETVPRGTLSATYADNGASPMPKDISGIGILGGFPSSGLTDETKNNKVDRVEGWGYHHTGVPRESRVGSKWPQFKYFKPEKGGAASMSYALFFKGKIAIHLGGLDTGSLACVHVEDDSIMKRLNYHTRAGVTEVTVSYSEAALKIPCCERYAAEGRMVSNPCGGRKPKDCPSE